MAEDRDAVSRLVPPGPDPAPDGVFSLFQGAQREAYRSWDGLVTITHSEVELQGKDTLDGRLWGRWWALYLNSDPFYLAGAKMLGVPGATEGRTEVSVDGNLLTATTFEDQVLDLDALPGNTFRHAKWTATIASPPLISRRPCSFTTASSA